MKLGVITDGINRDLEHSLKVMNETGLEYAELQFVWDKEIGDQTPEEIQKIKQLINQYNVKVPCITRHNFVGMLVMATEPEDEGSAGGTRGVVFASIAPPQISIP